MNTATNASSAGASIADSRSPWVSFAFFSTAFTVAEIAAFFLLGRAAGALMISRAHAKALFGSLGTEVNNDRDKDAFAAAASHSGKAHSRSGLSGNFWANGNNSAKVFWTISFNAFSSRRPSML